MNRGLLKALAGLKRGGKKAVKAAKGPAYKGYMDAVTPGAKNVQEALVDIIGQSEPGNPATIRSSLGDMAASPQMLSLLQAMPAAGAVYGTTVAADVIDQALSPDEESFANTPMDLLGMGVGAGAAAYGINRGTNRLGGTTDAGKALAMASAAGLGKLGSDVLQGIIGM